LTEVLKEELQFCFARWILGRLWSMGKMGMRE